MLGLPYSSVTPKSVYLSRRRFFAAGASAAFGVAGGISFANTKLDAVKSPLSTTEKPTPYPVVTSYNNFYEFGTDKGDPARNAKKFRTTPWTVSIEGAVSKPQVLDLDALLKIAPIEERIYRHRCVEAWSIVVPWIGFPLSALIKRVDPLTNAKYVAFQSLYDPKQMPEGRSAGIPLPYVEGLRIDEAMHPLALLSGRHNGFGNSLSNSGCMAYPACAPGRRSACCDDGPISRVGRGKRANNVTQSVTPKHPVANVLPKQHGKEH